MVSLTSEGIPRKITKSDANARLFCVATLEVVGDDTERYINALEKLE